MVHKRITSALLAILMIFGLTGTVLAAPVEYGEELQNMPENTPAVSFSDLPSTHWAYKYIADLVNRKVFEGYPDHKFRPDRTISRAEFATIIVKAAGLQPKKVNYSSFSDVKVTDWSSPWIETAKDYLTGYRTANGEYIYNPTAPALREDITVAIVKLKGYDVARLANRSIIEAMFTDYEGISESAKDYVAIAVENGIVSGFPDETFRPQNSITRAEAAALLWRAFMYGNDNKGVGGEEQATPITPTPAVTQPDTTPTGITPTVPQTPTQPQQPSQQAKFSVDTLVGGIGKGDVDGPVYVAKINQVDSMVVDKDNNIYFLDKLLKKVRKFNVSNGLTETLKLVDSDIETNYPINNAAVFSQLKYNPALNKVYLGAVYGNWRSGYDKTGTVVYEITPSASVATYSTYPGDIDNTHFAFIDFLDNQDIIFGFYYYYADNFTSYSAIKQGSNGGEASTLASSKENTGPKFGSHSASIVAGNDIFIFDVGSRTLTKTHLFPRKVETIKTVETIKPESVTPYEGKFYFSSGTTIYELTTDGKLAVFIDGKDLTYNDGNPIKKISQMAFDSNGNVIVYDDDNKAIRRINL